MFYVKTGFGDVEVRTEIHDDNVFCSCPECGTEVPVDLAELFRDGEGDLYGTSVLCSGCTSKVRGNHDGEV